MNIEENPSKYTMFFNKFKTQIFHNKNLLSKFVKKTMYQHFNNRKLNSKLNLVAWFNLNKWKIRCYLSAFMISTNKESET